MKEKFMNLLLMASDRLANQKYMYAIRNSFVGMLPLIIVGSFCNLFNSVICSTADGALSLARLPGMSWLSKLSPIFTMVNYATMNLFAIIAVLYISYELSGYYQMKERVRITVIALASYISLCATSASTKVEGLADPVKISNVLSSTYTGVPGLFLGMIVAIVATELYRITSNVDRFKIRMPESVPENTAASFNALIPAGIVTLGISAFGCIFKIITNITLFDAITLFIQKPLQGILTGLPGYLIIFFISTLLWFFGIHGTQVLKPIYATALISAVAENAAAVAAGQPAVHILNDAFRTSFTTITGGGVTGGLLLAIFLFSKREDWRAVAKISVPCAIFNINEPVIFGMPIVLNPILGIPFMLAPICTGTFGYFMTKIGFARIMTVYSPWTTPAGLQAFLNAGGHLPTALVQLMAIGISFLIYTPFVIAANKMAPKETTES